MVNPIGPSKIKPISRDKPVVSGIADESRRNRPDDEDDRPSKEKKEQRVGTHVDERC